MEGFSTKMVPIKCRDAYEIFKTKESSMTQAEQRHTYDLIIDQIRNAQKSEMTFESALREVTTPDVFTFIQSKVDLAKQENLSKTKNL